MYSHPILRDASYTGHINRQRRKAACKPIPLYTLGGSTDPAALFGSRHRHRQASLWTRQHTHTKSVGDEHLHNRHTYADAQYHGNMIYA